MPAEQPICGRQLAPLSISAVRTAKSFLLMKQASIGIQMNDKCSAGTVAEFFEVMGACWIKFGRFGGRGFKV